jgi:[ribosomal protein S18]-alanine N-acetyltransferase
MKSNIFTLKTIDTEIIDQLVSIYDSAFNQFNFRNWSFKDFNDLINAGSHVFYCIYDSIIVGFTIVRFDKDFSEIITIAIESSYQKKQIGKSLLNFTINRPEFKGHLMLEVAISNINAIHFYKDFGFKKIGQRKNYYLVVKGNKVGEKIDAIVMQLQTK